MPQAEYKRADQRIHQILDAARGLFLAEGWDRFSVERIADSIECSRPLIYTYFAGKEEILLALAIQSKHRRLRLAEQALRLRGRARERMLALGEVEELLLPRDLPVELLVASTSLRAKTSRARQKELKELDIRAVALSTGVIREAVDDGDLTLPRKMRPEELVFSMWAMLWGAASIIRSDMPLRQAGVHHPPTAIDYSLGVMLDGFGWRPLMAELDYKATRRRVYREVFDRKTVQALLATRP